MWSFVKWFAAPRYATNDLKMQVIKRNHAVGVCCTGSTVKLGCDCIIIADLGESYVHARLLRPGQLKDHLPSTAESYGQLIRWVQISTSKWHQKLCSWVETTQNLNFLLPSTFKLQSTMRERKTITEPLPSLVEWHETDCQNIYSTNPTALIVAGCLVEPFLFSEY